MLFPRHGFTSAAWDPPKWSTDVERIGSAQTATMTFSEPSAKESDGTVVKDVAGIRRLTTRYRADGKLLVYNNGEYDKGFAICVACGYAESEWSIDRGAMTLPHRFEHHAPITSQKPQDKCRKGGAAAPLRNQMLAGEETTDVLRVDFSDVPSMARIDRALATTLGYALQQAGARLLELDSRELGVLPVPVGHKGDSWGVMLYDNVPGGAGHVRELIATSDADEVPGLEWLRHTRDVLFVDAVHHATCETACLQCLLAFDAQEAMSSGLLQRRQALAILDRLLDNSPPGDTVPEIPNPRPTPDEAMPVQQPRGPTQERVNRAMQQRTKRR